MPLNQEQGLLKLTQPLQFIWDKSLLAVIIRIGIIVSFMSVIAFWGELSWQIDLLAHFQFYYAITFLFIIALALAGKHYKSAIFMGILSSITMFNIIPYYFHHQSSPHDSSTHQYKIVTINIHSSNKEYDLLSEFITQQQADFLFLQEMTESLYTHLTETLNILYPYQKYELREDNFGIATFSKIPYIKSDILYLGEAECPSILTEVNLQGKILAILHTHPLPPINNEYSAHRNQQLAATADLMKQLNASHQMIIGDLNATPWSYPLRRLFKLTHFKDSALGYGIQGSWPTTNLVTIPIDHVLISDNIIILKRKIGKDIGSDHYPVIVDFTL